VHAPSLDCEKLEALAAKLIAGLAIAALKAAPTTVSEDNALLDHPLDATKRVAVLFRVRQKELLGELAVSAHNRGLCIEGQFEGHDAHNQAVCQEFVRPSVAATCSAGLPPHQSGSAKDSVVETVMFTMGTLSSSFTRLTEAAEQVFELCMHMGKHEVTGLECLSASTTMARIMGQHQEAMKHLCQRRLYAIKQRQVYAMGGRRHGEAGLDVEATCHAAWLRR